MSFLEIAKSRYTTKKYDATKSVTTDQLEQLKQILQLSPSSINSQPWKFTIVQSPELKDLLATKSAFNEQKIKDASHLIVFNVLSTKENYEKLRLANAAEGSKMYYNNFLKPKSEEEVTAWLKNQVYISLGFFLAACGSMGIDATPMEGIDTGEFDKIINQDGIYKSTFAVAIGHRDSEDANQPSQNPKTRLAQEIVIEVR
ncbi:MULTISPECIES: nitroreductase family protein [Myroides]|uniref:NAD(P)H-dependent oxidoreductase n=1 Tax=Myroides albus TaxID=2562892 RepID=A0A6I3LMB3_9FLAO|nr:MULTISPECIES: nitroreductase family protein [Myroides]MTG97721.1 NAD(P)H-dependent oxidoreductase [Myroides albus]MVX34892.1 NAD(P)H-dependent oxidoreductase [Myroides sp. LoEW2-1]UVD78731.1 nitroreductase family protein [Myroides albus]